MQQIAEQEEEEEEPALAVLRDTQLSNIDKLDKLVELITPKEEEIFRYEQAELQAVLEVFRQIFEDGFLPKNVRPFELIWKEFELSYSIGFLKEN